MGNNLYDGLGKVVVPNIFVCEGSCSATCSGTCSYTCADTCSVSCTGSCKSVGCQNICSSSISV